MLLMVDQVRSFQARCIGDVILSKNTGTNKGLFALGSDVT